MNSSFNTQEHVKMIKASFEPEHTMQLIHPYNKLIEMDDDGKELRLNKRFGYFQAIDFKPFWEVS